MQRFRSLKHLQHVKLYHLTICFLQIYCRFHIVSSVHMTHTGWAKKVIPLVQCNICTRGITFFGPPCMCGVCLLWRRLREAIHVEGNSLTPPGAIVKHWAPEKAVASHFNRVPGPQKVYFNHWIPPRTDSRRCARAGSSLVCQHWSCHACLEWEIMGGYNTRYCGER